MAKKQINKQWTSVDDKLPEKLPGENVSDYVLVTNGHWTDIFRYNFTDNCWLDYVNHSHWGVTYWMPIPKLYTE